MANNAMGHLDVLQEAQATSLNACLLVHARMGLAAHQCVAGHRGPAQFLRLSVLAATLWKASPHQEAGTFACDQEPLELRKSVYQ